MGGHGVRHSLLICGRRQHTVTNSERGFPKKVRPSSLLKGEDTVTCGSAFLPHIRFAKKAGAERV